VKRSNSTTTTARKTSLTMKMKRQIILIQVRGIFTLDSAF
jgi:hypothetical protein